MQLLGLRLTVFHEPGYGSLPVTQRKRVSQDRIVIS
jgi:hypothetical protein